MARIGSDFVREPEKGKGPKVDRDYWGVYYRERSGGYQFQTVFPPLWAQRDMPDQPQADSVRAVRDLQSA